jgi:hypothetical protein
LIPELRRRHPGATVLMDNLSAHKPKAVESALTKGKRDAVRILRALRANG